MEANRVLEICKGLAQARNKLKYCRGFIGELKLSPSEIDSTQTVPLEDDDDARALARQIVKAVCTRLRKHVYQIASEKGIVAVGKPLPNVGYWNDCKPLIAVGTTGMFVVPQDMGDKNKKMTHCDPLTNPEFLAMLT